MKRKLIIDSRQLTARLLAGLLAFTLLVGCQKKKEAAFRQEQAKRQDLKVTVLSTGNVQPENRLEIKPPISGRVEQVLVDEGQFVRKGQPLALLSSNERATLLDAARAKGPEELARWEEMYKPTPLLAPLSGEIIARKVEPGQTVSQGDTLYVLSDHLVVDAQVDETDLAQVHLGQKVLLSLDAYPNQPIDAKVDRIAYEAKTVNNVTIYDVDILPQKVPPFMRSGMTANAVFIVDEHDKALAVPAEAVHSEGNKMTILLPDPAGGKEPVTQEIKTGLSDGKQTEILSGLKEGQTVLVPQIQSGSANPLPPWERKQKK